MEVNNDLKRETNYNSESYKQNKNNSILDYFDSDRYFEMFDIHTDTKRVKHNIIKKRTHTQTHSGYRTDAANEINEK